jgi:3'5'-cyclic nucleotide phosphodiesterase
LTMVSGVLRTCRSGNSSVSYTPPNGTILDEVKEIINMSKLSCKQKKEGSIDSECPIGEDVETDLRHYVSMIASMYHNNPFHNFEHACHVTMSVNKLLMRITTKEINENDHSSCYSASLCSDQLVAFAIVFSALIHDVDHRGCSNAQLIKEQPEMGSRYREKSVAEQNSLDLAWTVLMEERFDGLRRSIFANQGELLHFRQIIVNSVLATDIFDKELNDLRKGRWTKAFSSREESTVEHLDMKATIVIEHILQASDVSHTMQHWHVYRKWNTRLFKELYLAHKTGRMAVDPSTFWYKGELGFFDNYVIPLAGKLRDCQVFGVSCDEFLNYAGT